MFSKRCCYFYWRQTTFAFSFFLTSYAAKGVQDATFFRDKKTQWFVVGREEDWRPCRFLGAASLTWINICPLLEYSESCMYKYMFLIFEKRIEKKREEQICCKCRRNEKKPADCSGLWRCCDTVLQREGKTRETKRVLSFSFFYW